MVDLIGGNIRSILVVCTGNICRSPMAEGVLRYRLTGAGMESVKVFSAGTEGWNQAPATSAAERVCREIGVDISHHRSTPLERRHVASADLILTVQKHHHDTVQARFHPPEGLMALLGAFHSQHPGLEIEDPYNRSDDFYRRILMQICLSADGMVSHLIERQKKNVPGRAAAI